MTLSVLPLLAGVAVAALLPRRVGLWIVGVGVFLVMIGFGGAALGIAFCDPAPGGYGYVDCSIPGGPIFGLLAVSTFVTRSIGISLAVGYAFGLAAQWIDRKRKRTGP